jgi:hypothetical protein
MSRKTVYYSGVFLAVLSAVSYCSYVMFIKPSQNQELPCQPIGGCAAINFSKRVPVELNRGPDVQDGFEGDVHPILQPRGSLEVNAYWDFNRNGSFLSATPELRYLYENLEVAIPTRTYTHRDFSRFLPAKDFGAVGQMWALDLHKAAEFLKQFLTSPSMRLVAKGRRAGPDGAFAILRAISPSHLDIHFRIHAEFDVLSSPDPVISEAWLSPACFLGRLVINRKAGTVELFSLGVPILENPFNVHISLAAAGSAAGETFDWMPVDRMELFGGDVRSLGNIGWADQIETAVARDRLAKVFYKFKQIDWVPFSKAEELARVQKKPIFLVAVLGLLDNQSC